MIHVGNLAGFTSKCLCCAVIVFQCFMVEAVLAEKDEPEKRKGLTLNPLTGLNRDGAGAAKKKKKKKEEREVVKTGVIAGTGTSRSGPVNVETSGASPGDVKNVISAGVNSLGNGKCEVKVSNASKKNSYSARFTVRESNGKRTVSSKSFSALIRPEAQVTKSLRCKPEHSMSVILKSATKR